MQGLSLGKINFMRLSILLIICSLVLSSAGCDKNTATGNIVADSMQINRMGGFAGFNDHYMITRSKLLKDTNSRDGADIFNYPMPQAKYDMVKGLLSAIPEKMARESGHTYGEMVYDGIDYTVTAWYKGTAYNWTIKHNPPDYVQPFVVKLQDAFTQLR